MSSTHNVVIVGAGMAGLSAAQHLINNGFKSIAVLEAQNRYTNRNILNESLMICLEFH